MSTLTEHLKLYGIIGSDCIKNGMDIAEAAEMAVKGGVTVIQLREKNMSEQEIIQTAKKLLPVCRRNNIPLIINDSIDIALKSGADGVHLGTEDGDLLYARRVLGKDAIIGATAHNLHEAQAAWAAGADYLGCGAVFASPTKNDTVPLSVDSLEEICRKLPVPVVAIGGINPENTMRLKGTGVAGIAVVSAIFGQDDIQISARLMKNLANNL